MTSSCENVPFFFDFLKPLQTASDAAPKDVKGNLEDNAAGGNLHVSDKEVNDDSGMEVLEAFF